MLELKFMHVSTKKGPCSPSLSNDANGYQSSHKQLMNIQYAPKNIAATM